MKYLSWCLLTVALLSGGAGRLRAEIITFDELPTQPVDGLSLKGVTFHFTVGGVSSTDATFNSPVGPGTSLFIQDPALEGNSSGQLTVDFAKPTTLVQFGVALNVFSPLDQGATVRLFNGQTSAGVFTVATDTPVLFSEGLFTYSGAPVNQAVVTFDQSVDLERFVLDNLEFNGSTATAPEPASLSLLGMGAVGLLAFRRRTRR